MSSSRSQQHGPLSWRMQHWHKVSWLQRPWHKHTAKVFIPTADNLQRLHISFWYLLASLVLQRSCKRICFVREMNALWGGWLQSSCWRQVWLGMILRLQDCKRSLIRSLYARSNFWNLRATCCGLVECCQRLTEVKTDSSSVVAMRRDSLIRI